MSKVVSTTIWYRITTEQREEILRAYGLPQFALRQIDDWVFKHGVFRFMDMTNLALRGRRELAERFQVFDGTVVSEQVSRDGTEKKLVEYSDGTCIECVAIPTEKRRTFCISTMVGCPVQCRFCASGQEGLIRNLTYDEMLSQYFLLAKGQTRQPTNVVLMGAGEPLLNYAPSVAFMKMLNDKKLGGLGARRITLSTIGIPEGIKRLADEGNQFELAWSLHSPFQRARQDLIPMAARYPLSEVVEALKYYREKVNRQITIEYCLIADKTDSEDCARKTSELASSLRAKVNLIPYNAWGATDFKTPTREGIRKFSQPLTRAGVDVVIRTERGTDVQGACGQLKAVSKNASG